MKLLGLVLIAAILAIVARITLSPDVRRYGTGPAENVPAGSYGNRSGPYVMANYSAYTGGAPRLGDIVIVRPPVGDGLAPECGSPPPSGAMCATPMRGRGRPDYLNRVVGLPGDRLSLRDGRVVRNGRLLDEPYARPCSGRPAGAGAADRGLARRPMARADAALKAGGRNRVRTSPRA
jgi:signal peptidase I